LRRGRRDRVLPPLGEHRPAAGTRPGELVAGAGPVAAAGPPAGPGGGRPGRVREARVRAGAEPAADYAGTGRVREVPRRAGGAAGGAQEAVGLPPRPGEHGTAGRRPRVARTGRPDPCITEPPRVCNDPITTVAPRPAGCHPWATGGVSDASSL